MTAALGTDWPEEMSIAERRPPEFFRSRGQIDATGRVPQAHALRRAFDGLALDGILCRSNAPFLYFKEVPRIESQEVWRLYCRFWNQGLAPVLILITPGDVHIYSGLAKAPEMAENVAGGRRLVTTLNRVKDAATIRQLVLSLESGEFFRLHAKSFDPDRRVDRELLKNLEATRAELDKVSKPRLTARVLDALLCRVVFTCYLFDRKVIIPPYLESFGITGVSRLRDIVSRENKAEAKAVLYDLFEKLRTHFNGDLFSDGLATERGKINDRHLEILDRFLRGADVMTGQGSFWPYDFSAIPIETISAIYEHFLKADDPEEKKETGAFYTPRFLAEIVLDLALEGFGTLLDKRFLDPACGSGIFLVGLFNRLAEEWSRDHPGAPYEEQANALMRILRENLYGVDRKATACRIAAFSLYLAMLDQLKPSDIQELQRKGKVLPPLVYDPDEPAGTRDDKSIIRADFFTDQAAVPRDAFHLVIGNPPWASVSGPKVPAEIWCENQEPRLPLANRQLAQAFIWKAPRHTVPKGRICFVLPHSVLFNQQDKAIEFQREWLKQHATDLVLNLADFQRFLFEAEGPAVVVRYYKEPPESAKERIEYLAPKTDWNVSKAAVISVVPEDRTEVQLREVLASLRDERRPVIWKERFWGTPRDSKFLDRLADLPRLDELIGQVREPEPKRWLIAQGFQPMGRGDNPEDAKEIVLPTKLFINAKTPNLHLFLLESDCRELPSESISARRKTKTTIFRAPHVLVSHGMKVAYADFDVSFQHALQGIHGLDQDKELLIFLAAYLRSPLARYFLFHATSNWGVDRSKVLLSQLLNAPFPLPEQTRKPERSRAIVSQVAASVREATARAMDLTTGSTEPRDMLGNPKQDEVKKLRAKLVNAAQARIDELIYEYFDISGSEQVLVEDANATIIRSTRPSKASERIPTLKASTPPKRREYTNLLCESLNDWAKGGPFRVQARVETSPESGIGVVVLERYPAGSCPDDDRQAEQTTELVPLLEHLQEVCKRKLGSVETLRGLKVFDGNRLYLIKPLSQRFWTKTAALNDADDIAGTILMQSIRSMV
jgi:Eco57I restriction-modification methylase